MTETKELQAGRELDALVAERVMGWTRAERSTYGGRVPCWIDKEGRERGYIGSGSGHWSPSTDIAAAWRVAEVLNREWSVNVTVNGGCYLNMGESHIAAHADTAPLAICRAALAAVTAP